ncbi:hypothetical protein [Escherichia coli]
MATYWKFTDPRKDRDRVTTINVQNNGNVLNVIDSQILAAATDDAIHEFYLLETLILDYYAGGHPAHRLLTWSWKRFSATLVNPCSTLSTIPKAYRVISTHFQPRHVRRYRTDVISMRKGIGGEMV